MLRVDCGAVSGRAAGTGEVLSARRSGAAAERAGSKPHAISCGGRGPSPFDGDAGYATFFDSVCRALHRRSPRHVLVVRERGVGEQAVLLELARRGLAGQPPFLRDKQLIGADCRHTPPDRACYAMEAALLGPQASSTMIWCLDGLSNLLRLARGQEGAGEAILTTLTRTPCRVLGWLSPQQWEEHTSDDIQLREMFSTVHLFEPEPATALRLTGHFAAGLEAQYHFRIGAAAIKQAVMLSDGHILHERLPAKAVILAKVKRGSEGAY